VFYLPVKKAHDEFEALNVQEIGHFIQIYSASGFKWRNQGKRPLIRPSETIQPLIQSESPACFVAVM
jgi:hypothetical protein